MYEQDTRAWLERAVIGLNLCPFAKAVHVRGQVRYAVSAAVHEDALVADLEAELKSLVATPADVCDTTMLIAPHLLEAFLDFNDFLGRADDVLHALGLEGEIQIASFHPDYQFAGTADDDITNFTNRSPWPILHLLREASIDRAVDAFPDAEEIFGRNMQTLQALGAEGWAALGVGPSPAGQGGGRGYGKLEP
ncbi:MAG: DUF1415 domain-containing protein [Burkholderiales bacterium]|nr:MAG: DUF1415 domain-containing protein [Burkholderiales bacterium]